ncbi:3-hydroxyacyl-CoA dehydrogenase family protein [Pyxidicoccus trucidator]|uniref:3-hydroxyacyl-CoA dehydrogenase family protein n=1 Tax=Pyxidicoccus trucidator TaxID=2709662 RepID=UPI0013D9B7CF|nr:3-hydroxyacyl-CoA dehydrogenase family protein [Pyxidicoccus trucidator]
MSNYVLGVVGAGVMGTGIAQSAARAGLPVVLVDTGPQVLERSRRRMLDDLRLERMLHGGTGAPPAETLARITFTPKLDDIQRATFVVESIIERVADKERLFRELDACCPPEVCFASNTSAIPISRLAAATRREPRVLGMHFMNPVPLKPTVEMVRAARTHEDTLAAARDLLRRLGMDSVEVGDGPGFVNNRVLMLSINEAVALVAEGVAPPANVDRVFTACLGHKMGPLATADLIGLDNVLDTLLVLEEFAGPKYHPHPHLADMVGRGLHGRKSGEGFFTYPNS